MKKTIALLLCAAMLAASTSCARTPSTPDDTTGTGSGSTAQTTENTENTDKPVNPGKGPVITPLDRDAMAKEAIMQVTGNLDTFKNPLIGLTTRNIWDGYGIGDPFVMRWNGRYYLYNSTKDGSLGIQCWTSDDLVKWKYDGLCAKEKLTVTAYAPEVVYYNGYFYMYTSPAGNGHYVLRSESPTGPFTAITDNFGHSIDGSVFIDDNGRWYFYSAGGSGIMVYNMTAPDKIAADGSNTGAFMNGWTEGPGVIKVNGTYYMTYTGNHVWCDGYRINYATSTRTSQSFKAADGNPLLVHTLDGLQGIGHNSLVMGPNMDCYYIIYHSAQGTPRREMRADRIVFNGNTMEVLGPTTTEQQKPQMPDIYAYFTDSAELDRWYNDKAAVTDGALALQDGGWALAKYSVGDNYTAECNVASISGGSAGMVFSYTDSNNYGRAAFDPDGQKLIVTFVVNGEVTVKEKELVQSFKEKTDFSKLQLLTVKKNGSKYTFLVNNRTLCEYESNLATGAFGAFSEGGSANFGFMGITGEVDQSSVKDYFKPIPGSLEAITCVEDDVETVTVSGSNLVKLEKDGHLNFTVQVAGDGGYDLGVAYRSDQAVTLTLYQNGTKIADLSLPATDGKMATEVFRNLNLSSGMKAITFVCTSGSAEIGSFGFLENVAVTAINENFSKNTAPTFADGDWTIQGGQLKLDGTGKRLYGKRNWGDYTAEADITITGATNFGMLIRATNPSTGGNNSNPDSVAGTDFVQGYFIGIDNGNVVLGKQNYGWKSLKTASFTAKVGQTYRMKVEAVGATIKVWIDGNLLIEYTDAEPFMQGMVGFRGLKSGATVDNFIVTPK